MKINVAGKGGFRVDEDGLVTLLGGSSPELADVRDLASSAAIGPPLWAGPVEVIRRWAASKGHKLVEVDVPELPSVEGRVY